MSTILWVAAAVASVSVVFSVAVVALAMRGAGRPTLEERSERAWATYVRDTETYTVVEVVVPDTTDPVITVASPSATSVTIGTALVADFAATDDSGSGLAAVTATYNGEPVADGDNLDTSTIGAKTLVVTAVDNAGNDASTTVTFNVVWPYVGLSGPVTSNAFNQVKAGHIVPVKFDLGGDWGLDILAGNPTVRKVACSGDPIDPLTADEIADALTVGNGLMYDPETGLYGYNLRTDKGWANSCRLVEFTLDDGTRIGVQLKLTK